MPQYHGTLRPEEIERRRWMWASHLQFKGKHSSLVRHHLWQLLGTQLIVIMQCEDHYGIKGAGGAENSCCTRSCTTVCTNSFRTRT